MQTESNVFDLSFTVQRPLPITRLPPNGTNPSRCLGRRRPYDRPRWKRACYQHRSHLRDPAGAPAGIRKARPPTCHVGRGPTGVNSLTGQLTIVSSAATGTTATQTCPGANPNVVSGGYTGIGGGGNGQYTIESYPNASNQWTVSLNVTDATWTIYAVCAK